MKRLLKVVLIILAVLGVLLLGANLYIKSYLNSEEFRGMLADTVETSIDRKLALGRITYSIFPPSIIVRDVTLKEKDEQENFVSLQEFSLLISLVNREITHILLKKPAIRIVEYADGTFNFSDMFPEKPIDTQAPTAAQTAAKTEKETQIDQKTEATTQPASTKKADPVELKETALPLSIALIQVQDAALTLIKVPEKGEPTSFTIPSLNLTVRDISLDKPIQIDLDMKMGDTSSLKATTAIGPLRTMPPDIANMNIALDGVFDLASFKDLEAFMTPQDLEALPMTSMDFAWTGKGTLASEFDFDLTIKTPPVEGRNKLFLDLNNHLRVSLPEPALNNILYAMPLPPEMQPPEPPPSLSTNEICLLEDPVLALLLSTINLNTRLTTDLLAYENNEIHNLDVAINLQAGKLVLSPLSFEAFSGTAQGRAQLQLTDCPISFALDTFDIKNIQIADLIQANPDVFKFGFLQGMTGIFTMHADVAGQGFSEESLEKNLSAAGSILLADGQSVSTGPGFLDELYLKLDNPLLMQALPELKPKIIQARANATNVTVTKLENLIIDFNMKQGNVKLSRFQAGTPDYLLKATGEVNPFKETIDLEAQINLSSNVTMQLTDGKDRSDRLPYENGGLLIPLIISGDLHKPIPKPNLSKILQSMARQEATSALGNLLEKGDSNDAESAKDAEELVNQGVNLLNRFLKKDDNQSQQD